MVSFSYAELASGRLWDDVRKCVIWAPIEEIPRPETETPLVAPGGPALAGGGAALPLTISVCTLHNVEVGSFTGLCYECHLDQLAYARSRYRPRLP